MHINNACDYIITKVAEGSNSVNNIKLQKLLYYVQAWYLTFHKKPLYQENENFEAWIHGPVSRDIFERFSDTKSLYSSIGYEDIREEFDMESLDKEEREHIDTILETYAQFSGTQLENMTHDEEPWIKAREDYSPSERCVNIIDNNSIIDYYGSRLNA